MNCQIVWDARELRRMPTLATGQCCDLKVDLGEIRVWGVAWKNKLEGIQR